MKRRGFALIEVLVAVAILGIVVTTSLAVYFDRQKRLKHASENIVAYQALANEAEVLRTIPQSSIEDSPNFISLYNQLGDVELGVLESLDRVSTRIEVEDVTPVVKEVTLTVSWNQNPRRNATMTIYRTAASDNWSYKESEEIEEEEE